MICPIESLLLEPKELKIGDVFTEWILNSIKCHGDFGFACVLNLYLAWARRWSTVPATSVPSGSAGKRPKVEQPTFCKVAIHHTSPGIFGFQGFFPKIQSSYQVLLTPQIYCILIPKATWALLREPMAAGSAKPVTLSDATTNTLRVEMTAGKQWSGVPPLHYRCQQWHGQHMCC